MPEDGAPVRAVQPEMCEARWRGNSADARITKVSGLDPQAVEIDGEPGGDGGRSAPPHIPDARLKMRLIKGMCRQHRCPSPLRNALARITNVRDSVRVNESPWSRDKFLRAGWRQTAGLLACLPAFLLSVGIAQADGKLYSMDRVPPGIPFQRALILFHDGNETMLVQSRFLDAGVSTNPAYGWVVPSPAVPELASMSSDECEDL
jgi:hypothetical protein